jgi:L-threonylcarbamoyladenylate synthase
METRLWKLKKDEPLDQQVREAARLIAGGEVVAFPTETVYGLGANGLNAEACKKIFAAKGRPADNPLILHIAEMDGMDPLTSGLSPMAKKLMEAFWPGPMTLIVPKSEKIPDVVTAGLDTVAVRFPIHPVARELIRQAGCPIAAPSANKSGKPSPTNAQDVLQDMDGLIAGIIDGGSCDIGVESTIIDTTGSDPVILRPGGITREMIIDVMGRALLDPGLVSADQTPKAPGMKYRHYAPQAPMLLVEGPEASMGVIRLAIMAEASGLRVGVLALDETVRHLPPDGNLIVHNGGRSLEELAENLFHELRLFDREHVDLIIGEGVRDEELGLAIMNRMRKSAGHNILWAENGIVVRWSGTVPECLQTIVME